MRIHVGEGDDVDTILNTVDDTSQVASIVEAVLAAPLLPASSTLYERWGKEPSANVRFDMRDGTAVQRSWQVNEGLLWPRIEAPAALEEALSPRQS